ncbi:MAG: DNA polymerase III subunit beta [Myxococcota bacterium]
MKFRAERVALVRLLNRLGGIPIRKASMDVLKNVCFEADDTSLVLRVTDLEVSLTATMLEGLEVNQPGSASMDYKQITELLRACTSEQVEIEVDSKTHFVIESDGSRYRFPGQWGDVWPGSLFAEDRVAKFTATAEDLGKALSDVQHAVSSDPHRYNLNGICIQVGEAIRAAATDGHRLATTSVPFMKADAERFEGLPFIVPTKGSHEMRKLLDTAAEDEQIRVTVNYTEKDESKEARGLSMMVGDISLSVRFVEGRFPDIQQVMPQEWAHEIEVSRRDLLGSLRRLGVFAKEFDGIALSLDGNVLEMSLMTAGHGEGAESIPVAKAEVSGDQDPQPTGLTLPYLKDALDAQSEDALRIKINDPLTPVGIGAEGSPTHAVIMPRRLR